MKGRKISFGTEEGPENCSEQLVEQWKCFSMSTLPGSIHLNKGKVLPGVPAGRGFLFPFLLLLLLLLAPPPCLPLLPSLSFSKPSKWFSYTPSLPLWSWLNEAFCEGRLHLIIPIVFPYYPGPLLVNEVCRGEEWEWIESCEREQRGKRGY